MVLMDGWRQQGSVDEMWNLSHDQGPIQSGFILGSHLESSQLGFFVKVVSDSFHPLVMLFTEGLFHGLGPKGDPVGVGTHYYRVIPESSADILVDELTTTG